MGLTNVRGCTKHYGDLNMGRARIYKKRLKNISNVGNRRKGRKNGMSKEREKEKAVRECTTKVGSWRSLEKG